MSEEDESPRTRLSQSVNALKRALDSFTPRDAHMIADVMLDAFARDVANQAVAVLALVDGAAPPRVAYPNARAAFEAAQDALLLATAGDVYDADGARAYVAELIETEQLQRRWLAASEVWDLTPPEDLGETPEQVVDIDSAICDRLAPGSGDALRTALKEARRARRLPHHWSTLSRRQIVDAIEARLPDLTLARTADAFYGYLSVQSHPRLRAWSESRELDEHGRLRVRSEADHAAFAADLTFTAVMLALRALGVHRAGGDAGRLPLAATDA
jgi:hypothetical protein